MRFHAGLILVAVPLLFTLLAQNAHAGEPIELGGKKSFSFLGSVTAESQFASTILVGTADFSYITLSGRYEAGAGIRAIGLIAGPALLSGYSPYISGRINSKLFGPEENMLVYAGVNLGLTIFSIDIDDDDALNDCVVLRRCLFETENIFDATVIRGCNSDTKVLTFCILFLENFELFVSEVELHSERSIREPPALLEQVARLFDDVGESHASSSNSVLAFFRSAVSKPSVNQS